MSESWPVELRGVTESLVTTLGPNDRWNVAALGLHAPDGDGPMGKEPTGDELTGDEPTEDEPTGDESTPADRITARTWGRTRTRRNFAERGDGYVQFTRDPVRFVEATLSITERDDPVLDCADAVVEVAVERLDAGSENGTEWVDWALEPIDARIQQKTVPTTNRGYNAVVEATVAASRLDVPAYDTAELRARLRYFESVVQKCGGERERAAFRRLVDLTDDEW